MMAGPNSPTPTGAAAIATPKEIAEGLHEAYEPWDADDAPDAWLCSAPFMIDCDGISYPDNGQHRCLRRNAGFLLSELHASRTRGKR
jgi:hypothetical protein